MADKFNIRDYGAAGDGAADDSEAIRKAVAACGSRRGGTVLIPPGDYLTAPITFTSGMTLQVEPGATVLFSRSFDDYPMVRTRRMGVDVFGRCPQLYAIGASDVAITGGGTFNGQGEAWRFVKKFKLTEAQWDKLVASGGFVTEHLGDQTWWPTARAYSGKAVYDAIVARIQRGEQPDAAEYAGAEDFLRPPLLQFNDCRNVLIQDATFSNSPFWNCHLVYCVGATVGGCTFLNPWNAQNGDGLDIDSCRDVKVSDCAFEVGDDSICIKSGRDEDGRRRGAESRNIHITGCRVRRGHSGVAIGSEMSGGVKDVVVENCKFQSVPAGISLKTAMGRGGVVEGIRFRNIEMEQVAGDAIRFTMHYAMSDPALAPLSDDPPVIRNVRISNVRCASAGRAILLDGVAESPIEDVTFSDIRIASKGGVKLSHARGVLLKNVTLTVADEPALETQDAEGLKLDGFVARTSD